MGRWVAGWVGPGLRGGHRRIHRLRAMYVLLLKERRLFCIAQAFHDSTGRMPLDISVTHLILYLDFLPYKANQQGQKIGDFKNKKFS